MSGWYILGLCTVSIWGALLYLKVVADEIEFTQDLVREWEESERKARTKRMEAAADLAAETEEEPFEVSAVGTG